uniref:Uncharacterized protein n=1 Tax=Amphimedon queenslandica TaxID=400682 RepID=A0A1X7UCR4_AMPQE
MAVLGGYRRGGPATPRHFRHFLVFSRLGLSRTLSSRSGFVLSQLLLLMAPVAIEAGSFMQLCVTKAYPL